jgi:hypothetical protein
VTGADFGEVDLDRLADYVGGALDGTPDAATVAQLVATDAGWMSAYEALLSAEAAVRTDLGVLAAEPVTIPDDVAARLDDAFAAEPPLADRRLTALPGGRDGTKPRTTRRTSRRRWAGTVGVAAAVLVFGAGLVSIAPHLNEGSGKSATTAGGAQDNAASTPGEPPAAGRGYDVKAGGVRASGFDYDRDSLSALEAKSTAAGQPNAATEGTGPGALSAPTAPAIDPSAVPDALRRLLDAEARAACLKAILAEYGGTVSLLDYARYQGSPALVVLLDGAHQVPDRKWVVVVGPSCGSGGAIADQRYSAQLR